MSDIFEKFSLKGKTALVTGGAGLLGKEFSLTLAQAGAVVFAADLNGAAAAAVAAARACRQRWKNMPEAMIAMTCQASHVPAAVSRAICRSAASAAGVADANATKPCGSESKHL